MTQTTKNINNRPFGRRKKSSVKVVIVLFVILGIIIAGIVAFLNKDKLTNVFTDKKSDNSTSQTGNSDANSNNDKKSDNESSNNTNNEPTREAEKSNISQYDGEDPNKSNVITGVINADANESGTLSVRVVIDQALSSGTCTIVVSHSSGATNTVSAPVEPGPSSSFCIAEAGSAPGNWKITATVSADNKTGTITGEVNL